MRGGTKYAKGGGGKTRFAPPLVAPLQIDYANQLLSKEEGVQICRMHRPFTSKGVQLLAALPPAALSQELLRSSLLTQNPEQNYNYILSYVFNKQKTFYSTNILTFYKKLIVGFGVD